MSRFRRDDVSDRSTQITKSLWVGAMPCIVRLLGMLHNVWATHGVGRTLRDLSYSISCLGSVVLILASCSQSPGSIASQSEGKPVLPADLMRSTPIVSTPKLPDPKSLTVVRFGMEPYGDHTYAIIGVKKGWFKKVGIDLQYQCVKTDDVVPYLLNGTLDVASCPPGFLFSSYENAPNLVTFVFGDLFEGFGIMAQPTGNCKSYSDFVKKGLSPADALKSTVGQMRGKVFAYPAETAIKPFVDVALRKGGLTRSDIKPLVLDDPLTINAMRKRQADFQVGGAPSRVVLLREGFKCILSANDIACSAQPSPTSVELASILENGWVTKKEFYKRNYATILRLAAVNFCITRFMNDHQEEALSLHMPYLSQVTGQTFSNIDGRIIYTDLDPYVTFEQQREWFHNPKSTYFYQNINGSILNDFIGQGIYKHKPPTVDDVIVAADVYRDLEKLKQQSEQLLARIAKDKAMMANKEILPMYEKAQQFYNDYDFLDAKTIAEEITSKINCSR